MTKVDAVRLSLTPFHRFVRQRRRRFIDVFRRRRDGALFEGEFRVRVSSERRKFGAEKRLVASAAAAAVAALALTVESH